MTMTMRFSRDEQALLHDVINNYIMNTEQTSKNIFTYIFKTYQGLWVSKFCLQHNQRAGGQRKLLLNVLP